MFANNNLTEADYLNAFEEMNASFLIVYAEDPEFYSCYFKKTIHI